MKTNKIIIIIFGLIVIIVASLIISRSNLWNNNKYRILAGNHLELSRENKSLFWFDVIHSNNPDDIMFVDLESSLLEFMPDLVLVELIKELKNYYNRIFIVMGGQHLKNTKSN